MKKFLLLVIMLLAVLAVVVPAQAVEVEKLIVEGSVPVETIANSDSYTVNGRLKASLFDINGAAFGIDLTPTYELNNGKAYMGAGVYGRLFKGIEVFATKGVDLQNASGALNTDGIHVGARLVILDK